MKKLVASLVQYGPFGIFLLAILDSAGVPLPVAVDASILLIGAQDARAAMLAAALAVVGSSIGSMILFYLGRKGGEMYLARYTVSPRTQRFRAWFQHYGLVTVFIPCLLPIPMPMKVFVLSAGVFGVSPLAFLLVVLAARIPRYFGLAYMGARLGQEGAASYLKAHGGAVALVAVGVLLACVGLIKLVDYRKAHRHAV